MMLRATILKAAVPSESAANEFTADAQNFLLPTPFLPMPPELSLHTMSLSALANYCRSEANKYRRGEPSTDQYGVELLHRALIQRDPLAWEVVQHCFNEMVLRWMRSHPHREVACRFDSEENYVAQAFARFWQATAGNQELEFKTLAAALRYLQASLNGVILDTLRTYSRPKEVSLPGSAEPREWVVEDHNESRELWETIQDLLPNEREQRLAYLLFYCGLKPREIVHFCSQEWSSVQEIYRLRRNIVERLLRKAAQIRWRLNAD